MLRRLSLLAAALCISASAAAAPLTIDFETLPGPDGVLGTADDTAASPDDMSWLTGQYASAGVTFSGDVLFRDAFFDSNPSNHYISSSTASGVFSVPVYGISIDSKSYWNTTLNAYDALGNVIASATLLNPTHGVNFFEGNIALTSTQQIHGFAVVGADANWIFNYDNLVLDVAAADVPEPSAALLFPLALAGLAVARRRNKA